MSPFCLINVAAIRDHAINSPELREPYFYARLISWVLHLLLAARG